MKMIYLASRSTSSSSEIGLNSFLYHNIGLYYKQQLKIECVTQKDDNIVVCNKPYSSSELLSFWTLSIVRYSKEHYKTPRFKVQNPSNPECHTPSAEPFRIYLFQLLKCFV
jgi:hypothetical protein